MSTATMVMPWPPKVVTVSDDWLKFALSVAGGALLVGGSVFTWLWREAKETVKNKEAEHEKAIVAIKAEAEAKAAAVEVANREKALDRDARAAQFAAVDVKLTEIVAGLAEIKVQSGAIAVRVGALENQVTALTADHLHTRDRLVALHAVLRSKGIRVVDALDDDSGAMPALDGKRGK